MKKKISVADAPSAIGSRYPSPFDRPCRLRRRQRVGLLSGLTQFGVNVLTLPPGAWSSQRHWHSHEDEFVYVLQGCVTLVTEGGDESLGPGDCAGFPAGEQLGHCLRNESDEEAVILEIGSRNDHDAVDYPDIDMILPDRSSRDGYRRRDGTPYPVSD